MIGSSNCRRSKKEQREEQKDGPNIPKDEEDSLVGVERFYDEDLSMASALEDKRFVATVKYKDIKHIAGILREIGDQICNDYEKQHRLILELEKVSFFDKVIEKLKGVINVVDDVLEYLEYTGARLLQNVKEKEGVLRGIFRYSEIAFQYEIFTFLKLVAENIDVPDQPYSAQRTSIIKSLESIQCHEDAIFNLVEEAGKLLTQIIKEESLDIRKTRAFDDIVRRANLEINSCRRALDRIEGMIKELLRKANTVKWLSRAVRFSGLGISLAYLYNKYESSHVSLPVALGGGMLCGFVWLSLFPSRSYELIDSMRKMENYHQSLSDELKNIHQRMVSDSKQKIKLLKS